MAKILIVEDHAVVRAGIRHFLEASPSLSVTGEASTGSVALQLIEAQEFDIVLLDIMLPDRSGLEVLSQIKQEKPKLPVLILSMHPESRYAVHVLHSGASGYIQKDMAADELIIAIQSCLHGQKYISHEVADLLSLESPASIEKLPHETLSAREYEIFKRLSIGQTLTNIAHDLEISVKTVSTYRSRVLEKMNLSSNAEIVYYAVKKNIIS